MYLVWRAGTSGELRIGLRISLVWAKQRPYSDVEGLAWGDERSPARFRLLYSPESWRISTPASVKVFRQAQVPTWRGYFRWQIEAKIAALQTEKLQLGSNKIWVAHSFKSWHGLQGHCDSNGDGNLEGTV